MTITNKKILIVGPAWVGDMVMAQTLFKLIKQQDNHCVIDVLAPNWSRPLLQRMPEVRNTFAIPIAHKKLHLLLRYRIGQRLRRRQYDQAIILPNSLKSAFIPFIARIPHRTGWLGEWRWLLLNDVRYLNKNKLPLMIERFMALALKKNGKLPKELPRPSLKVTTDNVTKTIAKLQLQTTKPILALCPGAEFGPAKRWPTTYFAEVAQEKIKAGWQVWLFGSVKDQIITQKIQQTTKNNCIDLAGKTSLAEAIDLLSLSEMVVSNDSGLMHIAAALNRPLVVLYGSSSPRFTPPLAEKVKILNLNLSCSPCFKRQCPLGHLKCLQDLLPHRVLEAMNELMPQLVRAQSLAGVGQE